MFDVLKTTVLKILHNTLRMFPYRFRHVQMSQLGGEQQYLGFANFFLIRYDEDNSWPFEIL